MIVKDLGFEGWDVEMGVGLLDVIEVVMMVGLVVLEIVVNFGDVEILLFSGVGWVSVDVCVVLLEIEVVI